MRSPIFDRRPNLPASFAQSARQTLWSAFLTIYLLIAARTCLLALLTAHDCVLKGSLLIIGLALGLVEQARELPGQNVLLATVTVAGIAGLVNTLSVLSGMIWGGNAFAIDRSSRTAAAVLISLVWILNVLTSRGMACCILRRWRTISNYGLWMLALTSTLAVMMDLNLQSWAASISVCWSRTVPETSYRWYGEPWTHLATSIVTALFIVTAITPIVINKKPMTRSIVFEKNKTPSTSLAAIWLLLNLLFFLSPTIQALRLAPIPPV
jgi:hypothetical protein